VVVRFAMAWVALILATAIAVDLGFRARHALWMATMPIRYTGDITNGWNIGSATAPHGVVNVFNSTYDSQKRQAAKRYWFDYPPLRLLIMTRWAAWTKEHFGATRWQPSYEFNWPVLTSNAVAGLLASIAAFLNVWLWRRRSVARPMPWTGFLAGFIAAMLVWFNPAVLWNGHGFPQWDLWILPFFLFAVLAACLDKFLIAGILVAVGAMFKGQMLTAAPVLLLWPIFAGRWGAAVRFAVGVGFGAACVAAPWLLQTVQAKLWLRDVLASAALASPVLLLTRLRWSRAIVIPIASLIVLLPIGMIRPDLLKWAILPLALVRKLSPRHIPHVACAIFAGGAFVCLALFDGSPAWWDIPYYHGAQRYGLMGTLSTSNLATILERRYGWGYADAGNMVNVGSWLGLSFIEPIPIRKLLYALYVIGLILCGIAAAVQDRRGSARLMLALVLPFVLMFMLLPHLHNRYLIWGAATTAILVALGVGPVLLHLLLSIACWSMMAVNQFEANRAYSGNWYKALAGLHVDIGWALLLIAGVLLFMALYPGRRCRRAF
jgi:hypothetical protein